MHTAIGVVLVRAVVVGRAGGDQAEVARQRRPPARGRSASWSGWSTSRPTRPAAAIVGDRRRRSPPDRGAARAGARTPAPRRPRAPARIAVNTSVSALRDVVRAARGEQVTKGSVDVGYDTGGDQRAAQMRPSDRAAGGESPRPASQVIGTPSAAMFVDHLRARGAAGSRAAAPARRAGRRGRDRTGSRAGAG